MDRKWRTMRKGVHLAKTSPHRDRGWETDYPRVGSGSRNLGFVKRAANGVYPAWVWLANNVQVLWDVTVLGTSYSTRYMIYVFLNRYLPAIRGCLGTGSSHDHEH